MALLVVLMCSSFWPLRFYCSCCCCEAASTLSLSLSSHSSFQPTSSQSQLSTWTFAKRRRRRTSTTATTAVATIAHRGHTKRQRLDSEKVKDKDATRTSTITTTVITWQEEIPEERKRALHHQQQSSHKSSSSSLSSNLTIWKRLLARREHHDLNQDSAEASSSRTTMTSSKSVGVAAAATATREPHALRTDLWQVTMHWKRNRIRNLFFSAFASRQLLENRNSMNNLVKLQFADNGYVRRVFDDEDHEYEDHGHELARRPSFNKFQVVDKYDDDDDVTDSSILPLSTVGTWELTSTGLSWTLPLHYPNPNTAAFPNHAKAEAGHSLLLSFHGDFHLNPFGRQPKILRGVVLLVNDHDLASNNKMKQTKTTSWFRPVVATFHAVGIGEDTADLSYQDRPRRF
jgi:hypothetical protein